MPLKRVHVGILMLLIGVFAACGSPEHPPAAQNSQAPYPTLPALQPDADPASNLVLEGAYPTPQLPDPTPTVATSNPAPASIIMCTFSPPTETPTATIPPETYAFGPKQVIPTDGWMFAPAWIDSDTVLAVTQPVTESDLEVAVLDLQGTITHIYGRYNYPSDVFWINHQPVWVRTAPQNSRQLVMQVGDQITGTDLRHGHLSRGPQGTVLYTANQPPQAVFATIGQGTMTTQQPLTLPVTLDQDTTFLYQYALKTAWATDGSHGIYYSMDGIVRDIHGEQCAIPLDATKPYVISAEFSPTDPNLVGMIIGKEMDDRNGPYEKEFVTLNLMTGTMHHYSSMDGINSADFEWVADGENVILNWRYEAGGPNSLGIFNIYSDEFIKFEDGFDLDVSATASFKSLALSSNGQYILYVEHITPSDIQLIYRQVTK